MAPILTSVWTFLGEHQLVVAYVWASFCNSWPSPKLDSGMFYQFLFKFISTLGANPMRGFSSNLPVAKAQAEGVAMAIARQKTVKAAGAPGQYPQFPSEKR